MYKTSQVRVSLELVVEDGAVCGDEDGAAEGQGVVAHAGEEEERGVPEGERHGEEEEGEEAHVGAADARVEHDAVVVLCQRMTAQKRVDTGMNSFQGFINFTAEDWS